MQQPSQHLHLIFFFLILPLLEVTHLPFKPALFVFQMLPLTGPGLADRTMMCWTSRQERFGLKCNNENYTKGRFQPQLGLWENSREISCPSFNFFFFITIPTIYLLVSIIFALIFWLIINQQAVRVTFLTTTSQIIFYRRIKENLSPYTSHSDWYLV